MGQAPERHRAMPRECGNDRRPTTFSSRVRQGGPAYRFTASFSVLPALKDTPADGPMAMRSPVRGFRPSRAGRSFRANLPKPVTVTSSLRASASAMDANTAPTAPAYFFGDALSRPPPDGLPVVEGQPAEPLPPFEPPPFEPPPFEPFAILVPGAAGSAGRDTQAGRRDTTARRCRAGGQDRPEGGDGDHPVGELWTVIRWPRSTAGRRRGCGPGPFRLRIR